MLENRRVRSDCTPSYFRAWLANPLKFGAVAPSGPALAAVMTREIVPGSGPVLELGPGKGVFTRALLERGVDPSDLVLVERRADFAELLKAEFPDAHIVNMDAAHLQSLAGRFEMQPLSAVISGLPLLTIPVDKVRAILAGAFSLLGPQGAFYQFTYAPRAPVSRTLLQGLGLEAHRIGGAFLNIPPAAVYRITRTD